MTEERSESSEAKARPFETKRTHYWVLPRLQGRVMAWMAATSAVAGTTVAWVVLLVLWSSLGTQVQASGDTVLDADAFFKDAAVRVLVTTILLIAAFALVSLATGLTLSHRVAGPLHRIGTVAGLFAQGQLRERVRLRRSDYLHEFAEKLNAAFDEVERRTRAHQEAMAGVYSRLAALELSCADGTARPADIEKTLQEIMKDIREVRLKELVEDTPGK